MVQTDTIETVEKSQTALDFMSFDHAFQNIFNGKFLSLAGQEIGYSQNCTKIVGRMSP